MLSFQGDVAWIIAMLLCASEKTMEGTNLSRQTYEDIHGWKDACRNALPLTGSYKLERREDEPASAGRG